MILAPCRVRERVYSSKLSRSVHACEKIIARLANGELEAMSEVNIDKAAAKCTIWAIIVGGWGPSVSRPPKFV
jgi:hypothetical protein